MLSIVRKFRKRKMIKTEQSENRKNTECHDSKTVFSIQMLYALYPK